MKLLGLVIWQVVYINLQQHGFVGATREPPLHYIPHRITPLTITPTAKQRQRFFFIFNGTVHQFAVYILYMFINKEFL
jgi:hypothetical protein